MSRFGGARHSTSDLAYGEEPQRWDRDRFERYRRGPPAGEERETFRYTENDRPGHQEIRIEDRIERGPAPRRYAEAPVREREREREAVFAEDRYGPPARPRRSDRDLFDGLDPHEVGDRQLAPYRRKSIIERDIEYREINRPRPGLARRQSSLDTFDRRPLQKFERDEYHIPAGVPIPLPIRRRSPSRAPRYYEDDYEEVRPRDYSPHDYRDVEIMREKTVKRSHRSRAKSDIRSVASKKTARSARSTSSSSSSSEEASRHSSPSPERKIGKKGKTRMPKRLVRKQAVIDLGYPFEEEDDFIVVQRALDKDHIDEVIRISENYKESKTKTYRYDEFDSAPPPPPPAPEDHYEHLRTEWINPPSVRAPSVRAPSPARSSRTRRSSPARTVRHQSPPPAPQPQTIYIREPAPPPPPPQPIYIREPNPPAPPTQQPLTIVMPENRHRERSRDVHAEIRALEAERAALRLEREAESHRELVIRRPEETSYEVVEYRDRRPDREVVEYVERARSPKRDVVRIEKDRKGRMALVRSAR